MSRILVSIPCARSVRFFLETPQFRELLTIDAQITVMHGYSTLSGFFPENAGIQETSYPEIPKARGVHAVLRNYSSIAGMARAWFDDGFVFLRDRFLGAVSFRRRILILLMSLGAMLVLGLPVLGRLVLGRIFRSFELEEKIRRLKPDCIVLTSPVTVRERALAEVARRLDIPMVVTTHGWDTFTIYAHWYRYAGVAVWGPAMRRHVEKLGYGRSEVAVTGIPYAQTMRGFTHEADLERVRQKWRIERDERVIVMFVSSASWTGDIAPVTVRLLIDAIEAGQLPPTKIILRLPPRQTPALDERHILETFGSHPLVRVQIPSASFVECEATRPEPGVFREVSEILAIADVVTSQMSMSLLEGALLGASPVLLAYQNVRYPTRYVTRTSIFKTFTEAEVPVVWHTDELVAKVAQCLREKSPDRAILAPWDSKEPDSFGQLVERTISQVS